MKPDIFMFSWVGSDEMYLNTPTTIKYKNIVIGRYGGNAAAGANKNEDGAFVLLEPNGNWEFAMLLDAHKTAESAELLIQTIDSLADEIIRHLSRPVSKAFHSLEDFLLSTFRSEAFKSKCKEVTGETACLICARKENYLWWFSVGDNSVYLHHPELAASGQYLLNQRNFYEWVGYVNTFDQLVHCFSSGVREFRKGRNLVIMTMTTDGLLEYGGTSFADPGKLYNRFYKTTDIEKCTKDALINVHQEQGRDSATVIVWSCDNDRVAALPSDIIS